MSKELNDILLHLKDRLNDEEFDIYKIKIGRIMGDIFIECLMPLYEEHPELLPEELKPQN
jgi:hypothetical protein